MIDSMNEFEYQIIESKIIIKYWEIWNPLIVPLPIPTDSYSIICGILLPFVHLHIPVAPLFLSL